MSRVPKNTSISRSAAFKPVRVAALWRGEWCLILVQVCSSIFTWLSLQTDYAIRPSWTPSCRGVNNRRNSPAKSGRLIGCTQDHLVTPRLHAFFCAGASGDFSPSCAGAAVCVFCVQRWYSAYLGCNEWLFKLLLLFYHLQPVCAFSSDLWHKQGILSTQLPLTGCFLFFGPFSVNPRDGCAWKSQ